MTIQTQSFTCLSCKRSWPETLGFRKVMVPSMRDRCMYCGSKRVVPAEEAK